MAEKDPRRWWALSAMCLAIFLVAVDGTVLSLATPSIVKDLQPTASQVLWIGDIYSFVLAGLLITMGNVGDKVGRKRLLLIGGTLFALISIPAAYATSAEMLIAARALLGVAGATLMPSTLALMRSTFTDPNERSFAIGVWSAMGAAGAAAGPLVGGALLQYFWWGAVFLINVPIMALVLIIGLPTLRESRDPNPGRLDILSVALSMAGILGLVYAIKETAIRGIEPGYLLAGLIGAVSLVWFIRRQRHLDHPLVDVRLFASGPFTGAVLGMLLSVFGLAGALFFFSQYLQFIRGLEPLQAGLFELPATLAALVASLLAGNVMRRFGRGPVTAVGLLAIGTGMAAIAFILDSSVYLVFAVPLILIGAGDGVALTIASDTVLAVAPKDRAGAASAVSETGYELGTALGIALLGSVLTAVYQGALKLPAGLPADVGEAANESPGEAFEAMGGLSPEVSAALTDAVEVAFTQAMQVTTWVGAAVLFAGAFVTWRLLPGRSEAVNELVGH
ncbi:MAG: MFS transporter [Candidatus Nanopelagicales bacterium]|nr:MFS transporter [Candidatus Nanopelagicales bacterium]